MTNRRNVRMAPMTRKMNAPGRAAHGAPRLTIATKTTYVNLI